MIKLMKNLKLSDWILMVLSFIFIVAQVWLDLKLPDYMKEITTIVSTSGSTISRILKAGGKMLGCAFLSMVFSILVGYFASVISANFSYNLRQLEFEKITNFGMTEMKKFSVPSLITRTTNDITQIEMVIGMGLQMLIKAPVLAIWAVAKILGKSWQLSIIVTVAVVILVSVVLMLVFIVLPKFKKIQKQVDNLNRVTEESLVGVKVVRAFNAEDYQTQKFEKTNNELTNTQLFAMKWLSIMQPILTLVMSGLSLGIYYLGAVLINNEPLISRVDLLGDVVAFSSYAVYVVMAFMMLTFIFMIIPRAQVSAKRINEVLTHDISVEQGKENVNLNGDIEFKNVSFKFPNGDEELLENINFKLQEGETLAIIGASGSGKTTILNLMARMYDVSDGEILLGGKNIKELSFNTLYNTISYVPQKAVMFSRSIKDNVTFGETKKKISNKDIENAIEIAQATEFVSSQKDGLDYIIAQGGINISGGQKQRLAIARAISRKPKVLLFDDSFSALDFKTDKKLREQINKKLKHTTKVIVASRIGTIKDADKILVLKDGKIAGLGKHKELLNNNETYKEIALSQLSFEELTEKE